MYNIDTLIFGVKEVKNPWEKVAIASFSALAVITIGAELAELWGIDRALVRAVVIYSFPPLMILAFFSSMRSGARARTIREKIDNSIRHQ